MSGRGFGFQVSGFGGSGPVDCSAAGRLPGVVHLPLSSSNDWHLTPDTRHP